jgi:hypothetical protein
LEVGSAFERRHEKVGRDGSEELISKEGRVMM